MKQKQKQKIPTTSLIGAILLIASSVLHVYFAYHEEFGMNIPNWIYYIGLVVLSVGVLIDNYLVGTIGVGTCVLFELYWMYYVTHYGAPWQTMLAELVSFIALLFLLVLMLPFVANSMSPGVLKLWFMPGTLFVLGNLPLLFAQISEGGFYISRFYISYAYQNLFYLMLFIPGIFLICYGLYTKSASMPLAVRQAAPQMRPAQAPVQPAVNPVPPAPAPAPAQPAPAPAQPTANTAVGLSSGNIELLRKYKELLDEGILTQEEFDAKKKVLLG